MKDVTMISDKTPKYRRPVEKNEYSITCAIRKTPLVLTKTKKYTIGRLTKNNITLPQKQHPICMPPSSGRRTLFGSRMKTRLTEPT